MDERTENDYPFWVNERLEDLPWHEAIITTMPDFLSAHTLLDSWFIKLNVFTDQDWSWKEIDRSGTATLSSHPTI
jgi:hypothetical protein